jgi:hypothetical protein
MSRRAYLKRKRCLSNHAYSCPITLISVRNRTWLSQFYSKSEPIDKGRDVLCLRSMLSYFSEGWITVNFFGWQRYLRCIIASNISNIFSFEMWWWSNLELFSTVLTSLFWWQRRLLFGWSSQQIKEPSTRQYLRTMLQACWKDLQVVTCPIWGMW